MSQGAKSQTQSLWTHLNSEDGNYNQWNHLQRVDNAKHSCHIFTMLDVMCNEIILQVKDGHKTEWILCTSEEGKFLLGTHSSTIFTILMYVTQENHDQYLWNEDK